MRGAVRETLVIAALCLGALGAGALAASLDGCKPGVTPAGIVVQVEGVVASDLEKGSTLLQIQADVAAVVSADIASPLVATLVDDALQTLIDAEVLSAAANGRAQTYLTQTKAAAVAARASRAKAAP